MPIQNGILSFSLLFLLIMQYDFQIYPISPSHQNTSFYVYYKLNLNCLFNI